MESAGAKNRRRFEELLKNNNKEEEEEGNNKNQNVELGMVRVPSQLLEDLIHQGDIHTYYDVHAVPVAR
jgi:hypothetical protein